MKAYLIGAALLALQPAMVLAQDAQGGGRPAPQPTTRADVEARIKARFAEIDADHDGVVTRAEYDAWRARRAQERTAGGDEGHRGGGMGGMGMGMRGSDWFDRLDPNATGKVTLAQAEEPVLAAFDRADANHDGVVTPEERRAAFAGMMMHRKHGENAPPPAPPPGN